MFTVFFWSFVASFTTALAARTKLSITAATRQHAQGVQRGRRQEEALDLLRRARR